MKIERIGELKTVMSNPNGKHNYFGWPTIARLKNGRIAVAASGFRLRHVCPFGKSCISFSDDECETFTRPAPVIDTPLDDRDSGIVAFGESGVMITSFTNGVAFYRNQPGATPYDVACCDLVTPEEEKRFLGCTYIMSYDNGVTFGDVKISPISAPHGPIELRDGTIFYLGRQHPRDDEHPDGIYAYKVSYDGELEKLGRVPDIDITGLLGEPYPCEPHAIELKDGRILAHLRFGTYARGCPQIFTLYQTISSDGGKTWERPYPILDDMFGGAPAHLYRLSSGAIISVYAQRINDYAIKAMISYDEGKTWDKDNVIISTGISHDFGYPSTVELKDGTLFTIYYGHREKGDPCTILGQRWRIVE